MTKTFRQIGYAAMRRPDGSFEPSVPLYIDEDSIPAEFTEAISRSLAALFSRSQGGDAPAGGAA